MNGLDISRDYFISAALPSLHVRFPKLLPRLAAGLVGNGSECFGFDDEISRDHDWGADFFLWLPEELAAHIPELTVWKRELLELSPPKQPRTRSEYGARVAVSTVGDFYRSLIGVPRAPETLNEWINAPEENLAMTVNGDVFMDNDGAFSDVRRTLLDFYPEDLRLKRMSYCCMSMAQTGQYNFARSMRRGDVMAARSALSLFSDSAITLAFLLNKTYRPYYKWRARALRSLPLLSPEIAGDLLLLSDSSISGNESLLSAAVERVCALCAAALSAADLASPPDSFMTAHGEALRAKISNKTLRQLPAQYNI
ncbi:MAG: DUF4037 domain-containing protein [Oscillospiraceae bacterium]|jgi:hypothetical protein|nr:DUF4037 domain-containing protein [Oscillospiraceae bacterium]